MRDVQRTTSSNTGTDPPTSPAIQMTAHALCSTNDGGVSNGEKKKKIGVILCAEWLHWCAVLYESHIYIFFVTCVSALRHHRETAMVSEASYAPMPRPTHRHEMRDLRSLQ